MLDLLSDEACRTYLCAFVKSSKLHFTFHSKTYKLCAMTKPLAYLTICFTLCVIAFSTWQLFAGNFVAAFSGLPFLLIIYLFVLSRRQQDGS